jgi:uncharacterized protein with FMN-binding domain
MVPIKTGPFFALKIGPTYFNTMGGPRRNKFGQIINIEGMPIEGLFSGGELGSIFCDMYNGGGNLGETMVFGRISGKNAAARAKGEFQGATEAAIIWQDGPEPVYGQTMLSGNFKDGTYEGKGTGFIGPIVVNVTISDGKIGGIEIVQSAETATLGGTAMAGYTMEIIEAQGFDVDVISTATNTLYGLQDAVNDALSKAL